MSAMSPDPVLGQARNELSRSNIPGALENYGRLIKKGRFLEDVIYDLREALYRYPVEVSIWQSLGDAYMRANRLQDALDAYTKAEELLYAKHVGRRLEKSLCVLCPWLISVKLNFGGNLWKDRSS